ncbi:FMN-binding negative transcriptional regulator [Lentibacter algarum]|uniref:FMN-binding negative transcriptional regulator n=1 Tax=Lentibacter algarum TaxID=576131 RepID=UPI001C06AF25|nr:FMN-binding negative transcriptional regulator [Lentibacter algarum]MBU2980588.1 FMN-binding negative transcriptional regulator [Lentibacter algarum]
MHPNKAFRQSSDDRNLAFARAQGFGILALSTEAAPLLSHVPFLLSDDGTYAELHLVRSTAITRALKAPMPACLAVQGPEGYISPDWYDVDDQVPTWNYIAVHLTGTLERLPDTDLPPLLERLSRHFEQQLVPKPVWKMSKVSDDALAKMLRQIVPFRLTIESVDGTWKLGQNKPDAARLSAAEALPNSPIGTDQLALAALMKSPPES